jgi:hypothetical protein
MLTGGLQLCPCMPWMMHWVGLAVCVYHAVMREVLSAAAALRTRPLPQPTASSLVVFVFAGC